MMSNEPPEAGTPAHFQWLWEELDKQRTERLIGGSTLIPWEESGTAADLIWRDLTHPRFEAMLRERLELNLNPAAQEFTKMALKECIMHRDRL